MKKIFLLLISLVALQQVSQAQVIGCQANLMYYQNPGTTTVNFIDSSHSTSGAFDYNGTYMTFGNGTAVHYSYSGWQQTVTYNAPGTYNVCVVVTDSINLSCTDTFCTTITVTNATSGCQVSFSYTNIDTLYNFTPTSTSTATPISYNWMMYDNTAAATLYSGNATNPSVVIPHGHTVSVTLSGTDTVLCSSTSSNVITASNNAMSCYASFILWQDTSLQHTYNGYNLSTGNGLHYFWNWGDGTYNPANDTLPYPSHTYGSAGAYTICLAVWNSNSNCMDSVCVNQFNVLRMNAKNGMHKVNIMNKNAAGILSVNNAIHELSVYPNPASSELTIDLKGEKIESIKVMAISGQLMTQGNSNNLKINISELSSNIYFIEAKTSNGIYRTKFVKE